MKKNFPIKSRNDPISGLNNFLCRLRITEIIMILQRPPPEIKEEDEKAPSEKSKEKPSI
jgi:hypothetical protein